MTTDQKEKRNDEYNKYVKRVTPTHCLSPLRMKKRKNKREANRSPSLHAYLQMQTLIFLSAAAFTAASASA